VRPRTRSVVTCGALLAGLALALSLAPVPFVAGSPGPTQDVLTDEAGSPVITVSGAPAYETTGRLDLTTVRHTRADRRLDLASAFVTWVHPDRDVLPRDLIYSDDATVEDVRQENARLLDRSQEAARAAALRHLGFELPERIVVEAVTVGGPSDGVLEPGDILVSVDGTPVTTGDEVRAAVTAHAPGEPVDLRIRRDGDERGITVTTAPASDDPDRAVIGIVPAPGFDFPVDVDIRMERNIGGPSAGLVFALGIVDRMTPGPLLDGTHVAGTGTIDAAGSVGRIGGLPQKVAAAREAGADAFLLPSGNCDDLADARAGDMALIPVDTLDEALAAVEDVAAGDLGALPAC
jgi:PDZ domain-containing protein